MAVRRVYFDQNADISSTRDVLSSIKRDVSDFELKFTFWCNDRSMLLNYDPNPEIHNKPFFKIRYPGDRLVLISGPNAGEKESGVFAVSVSRGSMIFHSDRRRLLEYLESLN